MNIFDAIRTRRSLGRVKQEQVPRAMIEGMLEAATWAPNHYRTEPWRFRVMTGKGRNVLGEAYAKIALAGEESLTDEERETLIAKEKRKALRAPVVIAVSAMHTEGTQAPWTEELAAVHAAVQNMLLTAHALGLAAIWRSGAPLYDPLMHKAFDLHEAEQLVGLVYVGFPDIANPEGKRTPFQEKTIWIE